MDPVSPQVYPPRPSEVRARWVMILVILALVGAFAVLGGITQWFSIASGTPGYYEITTWQRTWTESVGLFFLGQIGGGIALLAWLSRVVDNVPGLGGGVPSVSPSASVGWWFVPVANLWKPWQIVCDVWRRLATRPSENGTKMVSAWWILWVCGLACDRAVNIWASWVADPSIGETRNPYYVEFGSYLAMFLAGILLLRIVWEVERRSKLRMPALARPAAWPVAAGPGWPPPGAVPGWRPPGPIYAPAVSVPTAGASDPAAGSLAFCPRCGNARATGLQFCGRCGFDLGA